MESVTSKVLKSVDKRIQQLKDETHRANMTAHEAIRDLVAADEEIERLRAERDKFRDLVHDVGSALGKAGHPVDKVAEFADNVMRDLGRLQHDLEAEVMQSRHRLEKLTAMEKRFEEIDTARLDVIRMRDWAIEHYGGAKDQLDAARRALARAGIVGTPAEGDVADGIDALFQRETELRDQLQLLSAWVDEVREAEANEHSSTVGQMLEDGPDVPDTELLLRSRLTMAACLEEEIEPSYCGHCACSGCERIRKEREE